MTESPFIKAEGPEPPDAAGILSERHQQVLSKMDNAILDQLMTQSVFSMPATTSTTLVEGARYGYTYHREQMQPDRAEIERVRAEVYRSELALSRLRNKLTMATDEISRLTQVVQRGEARLFDSYQLIGQLVVYLDSIEWGTHDEWTRSQSLRERVREYITSGNTTAT